MSYIDVDLAAVQLHPDGSVRLICMADTGISERMDAIDAGEDPGEPGPGGQQVLLRFTPELALPTVLVIGQNFPSS